MKHRYTIDNRLSDVITLISALAMIDGEGFAKEDHLQNAIRATPLSKKSWFEIADEHHEFFRRNGDKTQIALLLRSYLPIQAGVKSFRNHLSIDETQKLIASAITLYEKEMAKRTANMPVKVAAMGAITSLLIAGFSLYFSANTNNKNVASIKNSVDSLKTRIEKISK